MYACTTFPFTLVHPAVVIRQRKVVSAKKMACFYILKTMQGS